jgi:hypothetical protein
MNAHRERPDEAFLTRLIAVVGSDTSENERIERAIELCNSHVAEIKRRHDVGPHKRLSAAEQAEVQDALLATRNEILRNERLMPDGSANRRILKFARLAIELDAQGSNALGEIFQDELVADRRSA